jgi:transposase
LPRQATRTGSLPPERRSTRGLAPREKLSGTYVGRTKLSGAGRPGLRLAAWRAVWGTQRSNPVYAAR